MAGNTSFFLALGVVVLFIATPAAAFGAGDIVDLAKINAHNYRHGDIENTLLELLIAAGGRTKFDKLDVKRVYFGNWLRDYSQAIDVGGLKQLPAETIRILLWCLSFLTFGYATGEFEVTADRLGCYRPEEHIDNPKDYADNEDARQYDQRLRGPVNEGLELKVDPETGMKTYIAAENAGCETSAALVRRLFEKSIELGRKYNRDHDKKDFYEALRLLGTGLHCMEDYAAHSNYTELALRELGVDAFPHVGKGTEMDIRGKKIFPLVTGTFGMTDFLHSVVGELGDKVAQSEIEDLESKLDGASEDDGKNDQTSVLKAILDKVPWDMLEGDGAKPDPAKADELKRAANQKAEEAKNHPLDPNATLGGVNIEEAKAMSQQTLQDMYPILEFHDQVMQGVTQVISKVPGLDDLLENMSGALQIFVFSLLAPYVKPIIAQARVELKSTSEGVLKSSEKGQYEVFENDSSTDPTHSMLSKDHFSNVLNPVAGQIACATVRFVAPHIVDSWSDEGKDVRQTIDDILQIFHHPALRDENRPGQKAMFETVKKWWEDKEESDREHLKQILSTQGVKDGKNHEGEGAEGGHGHSHGAPPKRKDDGFVPSAQEGAGLLSSLSGGLSGLVLQKTGLDKTLGISQIGGQSQGSRRNDNDNDNDTESSSYNQGGHSQQSTQQSSYGNVGNTSNDSGRQRRGDNEESSYSTGGIQSNSGRTGHDNEESSYGGNTNTHGSSGRSGRQNEESTYGSSSGNTYGSSGRNNNNQGSSYEPSSNTYGGSNRNNNQESSYESSGNTHSGRSGRDNDNETSSYQTSSNTHSGSGRSGRGNEESSYESSSNTYGGSGRSGRDNDDESSSNTYGNSGRSSHNTTQESTYESKSGENNYGSSGRSGRNNEESSYENTSSGNTYGGSSGPSGRGDEETSYGGGRNETQESSYGSGERRGGGQSEYGRGGDEDQNEERRGGGGGGYGSRRSGREDESESRY